MAFWGVEVKPGKPFSHLPHSVGGRLHVSQATLGFGTTTKKSVVQCNVGNKSPVFLCSLFPDQSESCQLNVEFEEVDEVVFSVIGPRSVHLTGYYLGASRQYKNDDESESYGEDILDTETERSDGAGNEDQYEDSFIDDDEDLQVIPPSPSFSDGVNEDLPHGGQKKDVKAKQRRLRKKYQSTHEDASEHQAFFNDGLDIMDSECEDMATIRSLVKSCARKTKPGAEEESEKDGGRTVAMDSELNRKSHEDCTQSVVENDLKQKRKMNKKTMKEKEAKVDLEDDFFGGEVLTWDKSRKNETKFDHSSHDTALINADGKSSGNNKGDNVIHSLLHPDDLINGVVAEKKKKKKKEKSELEVLGADKPFDNDYTENQTQPDEARCGKLEQFSSLKIDEDEKKANDEVKKAKTGKRKIKQGKVEIALEADDSTRGDRAQLDEGSCENIEQGSLLEREDNQKQENDGVKKSKTGKRKHKQGKEEQALRAETFSRENQAQLDEGSCENKEQCGLLQREDNQKQTNGEGVNMLLSDELVHEKVKKPGKRKKKQAKEEKLLEAENNSSHLNGVDVSQHNEASCENILEDSMPTNVEHQKQSNNGLQRPAVVIGLEAVLESNKKRKKPAKDKALEADTNSIELLIEEKASGVEQNHKQTIEFDVDRNAVLPGNENHIGKKKRKKSKNEEALNMDESTNTTVLDIKENDAEAKPKRVTRAKKKDVKVAAP